MVDPDNWLTPDTLTEGVWQIVTETSTYIFDVDERVITRLPEGAGSLDGVPVPRYTLRKDGEAIPVILATSPTPGDTWDLYLDIRRDGVVTARRTTMVCHVTRLA